MHLRVKVISIGHGPNDHPCIAIVSLTSPAQFDERLPSRRESWICKILLTKRSKFIPSDFYHDNDGHVKQSATRFSSPVARLKAPLRTVGEGVEPSTEVSARAQLRIDQERNSPGSN